MTTTVRLSPTKVFCALLVLALLAASLPQFSVAAQTTNTCAKKYTVVSGDTLSTIAFNNNLTVQELAAANNLKDPYTLFIGQELCVPGATSTTTTGTTTTGTTTTTTTTTTSTTSTDPNFTFSVASNVLTITTANFPTSGNFFVRAGEGRFRVSSWYKLGRIRTQKTGAVETSYKLPKQLRNATLLTVCVKNATSDAVLCKRGSTTAPAAAQ